jgi:hypothetical protein
VARGSHESTYVGVERVGDVNEDLAGQRIAGVRDHLDRAGVHHGHDDDVTQRPCAERADGGSVADLVGERLGFSGVAAHVFDGVAVLRRPGADGSGMLPEPMMPIARSSPTSKEPPPPGSGREPNISSPPTAFRGHGGLA